VTTKINVAYGAVMALLGTCVFALPQFGAYVWAAIGLVGAAAVGFGAYRHKPPRPLAWGLLAAAVLAMAAGDTIYGATSHNGPDSVPTIADVCYLAMFPLIMAGMIALVRTRAGLTDWSRWLDVLTFMCAAALLAWVFLTAPALALDRLSNVDKSTLAAYNIGDLLVLATTVRMVLAARREPAVVLLALGAFGLLAGDLSYTVNELGSGWQPGGAADAAYLLFYATWGAAALQPSMVRIATPTPDPGSSLQTRWAALLGLSLLIPPLVLVGEALTGQVRDTTVIGIVSVLMSAFVVTRLVDALTQHWRALARESALRHASSALLAVVSPAGVNAAVHDAVGTLLAPDQPHKVLIGIGGEGDPDPYPSDLGLVPGLVRSADLPAPLRDQLDGLPAALVCPLSEAATGSRDGMLLVAADRRALARIGDALETLAAQATMALQRIGLTEELNRQDSDHYLKTITRTSEDMVLIVDDDLGIRYASDAVASTFGLALPLLVSLHDLEQTGNRGQIDRTLATARRVGQDGTRDRWHVRGRGGRVLTLEVDCRDLRQDRTVRGYVIRMRDVTGDMVRQREIIQQALDATPAGHNRRNSHSRYR
jgi:PAS domain S-box-containing protein